MACETYPLGTADNAWKEVQFPFSTHSHTPLKWFTAIEQYSTTALTRQEDKLPAIAGIAKRECLGRNPDYAAGLLVADLPRCLTWSYDGKFSGGIVTPYRAQSWSWASREGKIRFFQPGGDRSAHIDQIDIRMVDEINPFGQIEGGFLRITAPLFGVCWTNGEPKDRVSLYTTFDLVSRGSPRSLQTARAFRGTFFWDEEILDRSGRESYLLFVWYSDQQLSALILRPADTKSQTQCWERIGLLHVFARKPEPGRRNDYKWLQEAKQHLLGAEKSTSTLV